MNSSKLLSPQQTIIIQYLVNGSTVKEIAILMNLATMTVRKYIGKAKKKLGAKTHDHVIALAVARGEVSVSLDTTQTLF